MSPASRGRGLKQLSFCSVSKKSRVARFTRAWIETCKISKILFDNTCRPLHAGVD